MKGVSVVICCYNSGDKIIPTLYHLVKQQVLPGLPYEIIVVDNNCNDGTMEIVSTTWLALGAPFSLAITQQPLAGLNPARLMGIQKSKYDYVVLCDDDNWLCKDYLVKTYQLFEAMPAVALIGGVGQAVADIDAPEWFRQVEGFGYAIGAEGRNTGFVESIYGAGMSLRKAVFMSITRGDPQFFLSDRKGKSLSSGGDMEICRMIKNAGYMIYLDEGLTFKHFLSAGRLRWNYYLRLRKSFGRAAAYLQAHQVMQPPHAVLQENRLKQFISLAKFTVKNFKYLLFPFYFKNARCAAIVQEMSMHLTRFLKNKKLAMAAGNIASTAKNKQPLQYADTASQCASHL